MSRVDPRRVLITRHAVERYIMRYPDSILPTNPEAEIRRLLARAAPAPRPSSAATGTR